MTRIKLNWKKPKATGPVYLEEAAQLLDTTYEALRARVHRMMNEDKEDHLPKPFLDNSTSRERWAFDRDEFAAFVKTKKQLDKIIQNSRK